MLPYIITAVVSIIITALIVWFAAASYEKKSANSKIGNAEEKARGIIDEAVKTAEEKKRESMLEIKEESIKAKNDLDKEIKERRNEISRNERRIVRKDDHPVPGNGNIGLHHCIFIHAVCIIESLQCIIRELLIPAAVGDQQRQRALLHHRVRQGIVLPPGQYPQHRVKEDQPRQNPQHDSPAFLQSLLFGHCLLCHGPLLPVSPVLAHLAFSL